MNAETTASLLRRARHQRIAAALVARLALLLLSCAAQPVLATVLTFDQVRIGGKLVPTIGGNGPETDYGDRAYGATTNAPGGQFTYGNAGEGFTPNVVADFFSGSDTSPAFPRVSLWQDGYGDLINNLFGNNNSLSLNVRLTADPGFVVQLHDFDVAGWPNADYTIAAVRVLDGSTELFAQPDVKVEGDAIGARHTSFSFATALSAASLFIQIDYGNLPGGQQDNIGIDNIRFSQSPPPAVPWPPSAPLLAAGLLVVAWRVRRFGEPRPRRAGAR